MGQPSVVGHMVDLVHRIEDLSQTAGLCPQRVDLHSLNQTVVAFHANRLPDLSRVRHGKRKFRQVGNQSSSRPVSISALAKLLRKSLAEIAHGHCQ